MNAITDTQLAGLVAGDAMEVNKDNTSNASDCLIRLENISFSYPGVNGAVTEKKVLDHLDFEIFKNDRIGMMAPNGSGKTTLLHTIMGLCTPQEGTIEILGAPMKIQKDFTGIRTRIGLLFQDSDDQLFCPSVLDDVAFGPLNMGHSKKEAKSIAIETLESLGISHLSHAITHRLSGGQKRLVALAAVLALSPKVLLLDEPTAGLDPEVKAKLGDVLNQLDITYLVISHEFDFISQVSDKVYSMENGKIFTDEQIHVHHHEHIHKHGNRPHIHK